MSFIDILGMAAATLTTGSFVPQVVRLWRTRNSEGISLVTFTVFGAGLVLWLTYGIILHAAHLARKLKTLRLAARECRRGLTKREIAQAQVG